MTKSPPHPAPSAVLLLLFFSGVPTVSPFQLPLSLLSTPSTRFGSTALFSSSTQSSSSSAALSSSSASYLATCVPGLAHVLQQELQTCHPDIVDIQTSGNAAVTFRATREASLHALCWLRTAHRLLELVASTDHDEYDIGINSPGTLHTRDDIHDFIRNHVNVKDLLGDGQGGLLTLSVKAVLNNPRNLPQDLSHSHYTALTVKNALCDVVRDLRGDRPDVRLEDPDVPLVAILRGESASVGRGGGTSVDGGASMSLYRSLHPPGSLHKRGYRQGSAIHKAAMKESLAAGLLLEAGWMDKLNDLKASPTTNCKSSLQMIDPMCGSGSLCLEAAMMAADIAPGLMRIRCGLEHHSMPPVTRWKTTVVGDDDDTDATSLWKSVLLDATQRAQQGILSLRRDPERVQIWGNDIHRGALETAESALETAGLLDFVRLSNNDCYDLQVERRHEASDDDSCRYLVATNPPWGVRLTDDVAESWEGLRHFIRDACPSGTEVWILSGDKSATATLKLKRDCMIPLQTGDQHLRWIRYTIRGKSDFSPVQQEEEKKKEDDAFTNDAAPVSPVKAKTIKVTSSKQQPKARNEWL